jgi:poly(A) polymerase
MEKINFKIELKNLGATANLVASAFEIVKTLQKAGFETYIAGGAVRDMILGAKIHDLDIATSARPEEIKKIFPNAYDRGKAFGVMAIKVGDHEFEIATFRQDVGGSDHRHPETVEFTSAKEDSYRRDFTINGLFYDPEKEEIIDYVGGLTDLKRKQIKFIGSSEDRLDEDYLRMLRAVRFAARFNFELEKESKLAIKKMVKSILEISMERIREELSKMLLLSDRVSAIELLDELGLMDELLPELRKLKNVPQPKEFHMEGDCFTHTMLALQNIEETDSEELVWTVILHDIAKPETIGYRAEKNKTSITFFDHDVQSAEKAEEILTRFRFSHHFIDKVSWAIRQHMRIVHAFTGMSERKQKKLFVDPNIELLLALTYADLSASLRPNGKPDMQMYRDALALRTKFEAEMSVEEKQQVKKFDLVDGKDIMKILQMPAGPEVGKIKNDLEQAYLDGKISTRSDAVLMLEKYR